MSDRAEVPAGRPAEDTSSKKSAKHRSPRKINFTCTGCGQVSAVTSSSMRRPSWSGLCVRCVRKHFSRKLSGDERHGSGTIIHWNEREPGKLSKISITCYRCQKSSYLYHSWIKNPRWSGLCHDCTNELGRRSPRRRVGDQTLPSGSIIHWSERDKKQVPVTCALGCHRWVASIDVVRTLLSKYLRLNQGEWPGYCPTHRRNVAALTALLTKPSVKRRRGRQAGSILIDVNKTLADIQKVLSTFKAQGMQRSSATANRVASTLHIGSDITGGDTLMRRVKKCGIKSNWTTLRDYVWGGGELLGARI